MSRLRVYRIEFDTTTPPDGWDMEMAEAHPRFARWVQNGDGYHEPRDEHIAEDADGLPIWSPPARRNFLSRSGARSFARELEQMGVLHRLLRSGPVEFEPLEQLTIERDEARAEIKRLKEVLHQIATTEVAPGRHTSSLAIADWSKTLWAVQQTASDALEATGD